MQESFVQEAEMVGGPQDGGRLCAVGGHLPQTVYVGRRWPGDRFSAWSDAPSDQFPVCYVLDHALGQSGGSYKYRPCRRGP